MSPSNFASTRRRVLGAGVAGTLVAVAGCLDGVDPRGNDEETGRTLRFALAPGPERLRDR
jgi:hypothetical protein